MATAPRPPRADLTQAISRLLARGPQSAADLQAALKISQPTLSRTIQQMAQTVCSYRVTGLRTPQYALLRALPLGLPARQRIDRVLSTGQVLPFAQVAFLAGGATLEQRGTATRVYAGLPPYLAFAAPSGFMGRQVAQQMASVAAFPASLSDWGDDHRVAWLFTRGLNLPGNLVFGDALQAELDLRGQRPTPAASKLAHYLSLSTRQQVTAQGSSAGGEQPKFLALAEDTGHVIVKFAKRGSRMAQLLPLEHLALQALAAVGLPASRTQLLAAGDQVFLEVQRFDRVGRTGRVGLLSAGALDDEWFGQRDSWSQFAARCKQSRVLSAADARQVDTLAAFSELIGNTDRHFENISLLIGDDGQVQDVAPAYDILPMRYASIGGGVDPALTPIAPQVGRIGAQPEVWARAAQAAGQFWQAAATAKLPVPLTRAMRDLARANLQVVRAFVGPLVPG